MALTGSEEHHGIVRTKVAEFLAKGIYDKWAELLIMDETCRLEHLRNVSQPARDASEVERYARDIDFAAASKFFSVNVLVFSSAGWRCYAPNLDNSWQMSKQDEEVPSVAIQFFNSHFEIVLDV